MNYLEIQKLIKQGNIKKAQKELQSKSFQEKQSKTHQKTLRLLQNKTDKLRKVFVKNNLNKAKKYIRKEELQNAYQLIQDLERIDPGNNSIQKLKNQIVKKINSSIGKSAQKLYQQTQKQIQDLIQNNQNQDALKLVYNLQQLPETLRKELEIETKRKIIDHKLKTNNHKLKQTPIPQKYDFIKNLYDLDPTYKKIQTLLLETREDLRKYSKTQKKNILQELIKETKILFNKKQYLKAKRNAERVLQIDSNNSHGLKFYQKSDYKYYSDNFHRAYQILKSK